MLNKEAKRELLVVSIILLIVLIGWVGCTLMQDADKRAKEWCYDVCTRVAIQSMVRAKVSDEKIMDQVYRVKESCREECN